MEIKPGDIIKTYIPFRDNAKKGKVRPVLILVVSIKKYNYVLTTLNITKEYQSKSNKIRERYFRIGNGHPSIYKKCGLKEPSCIDIRSQCQILYNGNFLTKYVGRLPLTEIIKLRIFIEEYKKRVNHH